jgi:hypothetical protein
VSLTGKQRHKNGMAGVVGQDPQRVVVPIIIIITTVPTYNLILSSYLCL